MGIVESLHVFAFLLQSSSHVVLCRILLDVIAFDSLHEHTGGGSEPVDIDFYPADVLGRY